MYSPSDWPALFILRFFFCANQIATIVPSPSVEASSREIYMKTTPRLVVNGTNFNTKSTELYFDPPLQEGTVIQKQVRVGAVMKKSRKNKMDVIRVSEVITSQNKKGSVTLKMCSKHLE